MSKSKRIILTLLCAAPLLYATYANATMYKWTDANGEIHYTQTPPANSDVTIIPPPSRPASSAGNEIKKAENLEKQLKQSDEDAAKANEKAKIAQEEAKLKAVNCERAKTHLDNLQSKVRIRMTDAKGNVEQLTPTQRMDELQKTKDAVKEYCQ